MYSEPVPIMQLEKTGHKMERGVIMEVSREIAKLEPSRHRSGPIDRAAQIDAFEIRGRTAPPEADVSLHRRREATN